MLVLHFMAYYDTGYFHVKLNLIITQLEYIVDRVMVPLNRVFSQCNHICLYGKALMRCYCRVSRRCLQRGKVMGVRYIGLVSRHNLVCLLLRLWYRVHVWDHFMFWPWRWSLCLVDTGSPRTSPMGSESEWPGECHGNGRVSSECRWSTWMGVRGHGFHGVGIVC